MLDIDGIHDKIAALYARRGATEITIPLQIQTHEFVSFATEYIAAAITLDKVSPQHLLPRLQLTGLAIELALKACIASTANDVPHEHDLVRLVRRVDELGFTFSERDFALIVHLNHIYFRDLATGTRFKSRYPATGNEPLGGGAPDATEYATIVERLVEQAQYRLPPNHRLQLTGDARE